jgi:hypothetical protein
MLRRDYVDITPVFLDLLGRVSFLLAYRVAILLP